MNVCFVKYICPESNEYRWLEESLGFSIANRLCKLLAQDGRKPVLYRAFINPELAIKVSSNVQTVNCFRS